jgi:hypothetical protein
MAKNHVGENALQRLLRGVKGLNAELIRPGESKRIELRLNTADGEDAAELIFIEPPFMASRLIGGSLEEIESFLAASPLARILAARADGEKES